MAQALAAKPACDLDEAAIGELRNALRGAQPGDAGYGEARSIWNGMIARRPALIARVSGAADVVACVNFARDNGLPLSIRGGGHNIAGTAFCDGGLMIDMSLRRGVRVEPGRRIVRGVQPTGWTGEVSRIRLFRPGFRGESPWPSTAAIRSSSSGKSSRTIWPARPSTGSPNDTTSAAT